jgi:hypothetical protein
VADARALIGSKGLLRWEKDVASELESGDLATAPFVYTLDRLFKLTDSTDVVIEERQVGRCCCKGRAYALHCALGNCASQAINRGGAFGLGALRLHAG